MNDDEYTLTLIQCHWASRTKFEMVKQGERDGYTIWSGEGERAGEKKFAGLKEKSLEYLGSMIAYAIACGAKTIRIEETWE